MNFFDSDEKINRFLQSMTAVAMRSEFRREADDFAQFCFLEVWKKKYFISIPFLLASYARYRLGDKRTDKGFAKRQALRVESNGDSFLGSDFDGSFIEEFIAAPETEVTEERKLILSIDLLAISFRARRRKALKKMIYFFQPGWHSFRDSLRPLSIDWIRL